MAHLLPPIPLVFGNIHLDQVGQRYTPTFLYCISMESPVLCVNNNYKASCIVITPEGIVAIVTLFADTIDELDKNLFLTMMPAPNGNIVMGGRLIHVSNMKKQLYYGSHNAVCNVANNINSGPFPNQGIPAQIFNYVTTNMIITLH